MDRDSILASLAIPDRAWVVLLVGIVMMYRELMAPGRVLPGVFGGVAICVAIYSLARYPWNLAAAASISAGIALLILQGFQRLYWLPTAAAALLIAIGAHSLTDPPINPIPAAGAIPLSAATGFLLHTAIAARRRKRAV